MRAARVRAKLSVVFLFVLLVAAASAGAEPPPPVRGVDVLAYTFALELGDESDEITGNALIEAEVAAAAPALALDLRSPGVDGRGMTVTAVVVLPPGTADRTDRDGLAEPPPGEPWMETMKPRAAPLVWRHQGDRLVIELPAPAAAAPQRQTHRVLVSYRGVPADGLIIGSNTFGERTFFADNWPNRAHHWLPVVDHPADKAHCSFDVVAPAHYQVVASGRLREEVDLPGGRRRTRFASDQPLAAKVMVIGVARFAVLRQGESAGIPIESWVYPQDRDQGYGVFARVPEIVRFFVERLGPFPYAKLASVQSTTRYGGMENAGNIFYAEKLLREQTDLVPLLAHEIAHQWFGDMVSEAEWSDLWLSEGFATYLAMVYLEHQHGAERLRSELQAAGRLVLEHHGRNPEASVLRPASGPVAGWLNPLTYQKGALVLHLLRRELGDEAFWRAVRLFAERHRHGNARTADLRAAVEEVARRDLGWFFTQWLERAGLPDLLLETRYDQRRREVDLTVEQRGEPFRLPLTLELRDAGGASTRVEETIDGPTTRIVVPMREPPVAVVADPDRVLPILRGPCAAAGC